MQYHYMKDPNGERKGKEKIERTKGELNTYDRLPLRYVKLLEEPLSTFLECLSSSQKSSGQIGEPCEV